MHWFHSKSNYWSWWRWVWAGREWSNTAITHRFRSIISFIDAFFPLHRSYISFIVSAVTTISQMLIFVTRQIIDRHLLAKQGISHQRLSEKLAGLEIQISARVECFPLSVVLCAVDGSCPRPSIILFTGKGSLDAPSDWTASCCCVAKKIETSITILVIIRVHTYVYSYDKNTSNNILIQCNRWKIVFWIFLFHDGWRRWRFQQSKS